MFNKLHALFVFCKIFTSSQSWCQWKDWMCRYIILKRNNRLTICCRYAAMFFGLRMSTMYYVLPMLKCFCRSSNAIAKCQCIKSCTRHNRFTIKWWTFVKCSQHTAAHVSTMFFTTVTFIFTKCHPMMPARFVLSKLLVRTKSRQQSIVGSSAYQTNSVLDSAQQTLWVLSDTQSEMSWILKRIVRAETEHESVCVIETIAYFVAI